MRHDTDDDTLMALVADGEEAAFRLLVQRWETDVRTFLIHMVGSVDEAEDLCQETFVKVFRQAGKYRPQGLFRSWLLRIAGNLARSRLRRRKIIGWVRFDTTTHDTPAPDAGPLAALERDEATRTVRAAVDALPERQKQALVLHRFQGLRYREVAEAMETTVPGVESLIQRALAGLRERLGDADV
ncbi:sigma-70 family RNA polymerase sigma factor [bacterium]|nr:sigma-70 family RNA polymerase sigma factor [bacterium]